MDTSPLVFTVNRSRPLIFLLVLLLVQLGGCEARKEKKVPIGIITTTNYCQGVMTSADVKVKPGYIALSHDIEKQHRLKFGDLIYLEGESEPYEFMDRMPPQWARRADLYSRSCKNAREYGVQKRMVWFVRKQHKELNQ
ncbi:MAG: hypothetical protein NTW80_09155 [Deltaproteobacteria bacterium]|nr:hypothetical protein [Deltaproteobacteria bacterium]